MTPHRLAKPQHKHTRKSFWGTISERSIAVLQKRAHANERATDTCSATDAAGSCSRCHVRFVPKRTFRGAISMSALPPKVDIRGTNVRFMPAADMDRHRVSVSGGFRKACSSDIPPHQNRLAFRPACSPSRDGSRVERVCSRRRCKQSVAVPAVAAFVGRLWCIGAALAGINASASTVAVTTGTIVFIAIL